jgi:CubicO group peptidase (beta-lactamase class C family)
MKITVLYSVLIAGLLSLLTSCKEGEVVNPQDRSVLEHILTSEFQKLNMPGYGVAAVKGDSVVYMNTFGHANVRDQVPFTPQTRMVIASISKTFIATAIMQLWEQEKIGLDDDINRYLPFEVRNPNFPGDTITVRMLMTHTSSITDAAYRSDVFYLFGYVDYPETIGSFLQNYLRPDGAYYDPILYSKQKPGTAFSYSNVASTLLAYLVERVSGTDFNSYCKAHIFQPLKMTRTTWMFSETPQNEVALHYTSASDRHPAKPYLTYPDYPDGHLITTVEDLSRFMRAFINRGTFDGTQLLAPATIQLMLSEQSTLSGGKQGLIFAAGTANSGEVWGHSGGDPGTSTLMYFDTLSQTGAILLCNQTLTYSYPSLAALLQYADQ